MVSGTSGPTLEIRATARFRHLGDLAAGSIAHDPRSSQFPFVHVVIDLTNAKVIGIPALLWCVVFLGLSRRRGARCEIFAPSDADTQGILWASGAGTELDNMGVALRNTSSHGQSSLMQPIKVIQTLREVEDTANEALYKMIDARFGPISLIPSVTESFGELAGNAVEHSHTEVGPFGILDMRMDGEQGTFEVGVADGGVGIRSSLANAESLRPDRMSTDWSAIDYATNELVSGTGDPHRGIGLFGVAEDSKSTGRNLRLHSGHGVLYINGATEIRAIRNGLFPGTLAYMSIPFPIVT